MVAHPSASAPVTHPLGLLCFLQAELLASDSASWTGSRNIPPESITVDHFATYHSQRKTHGHLFNSAHIACLFCKTLYLDFTNKETRTWRETGLLEATGGGKAHWVLFFWLLRWYSNRIVVKCSYIIHILYSGLKRIFFQISQCGEI